jgi:riboflavin transporter FmnP
MKFTTKNLVTLALLSAIAYILAYFAHVLKIPVVPSAPYLTLDIKDAIIVTGGFLYGPLAVVMMSFVVSLAESFLSGTGHFGILMNMISTCAFGCTAAWIYHRNKSFVNAVAALVAGCICATLVMLPANYAITPLYTGAPREFVASILIPAIMPFNLIKGGINAVIAILLYKPVKLAFKKLDKSM